MEISEEFFEGLEMVLLEAIEDLKDSVLQGEKPSPLDISVGYMSPEYGGEVLSSEEHIAALACLLGLSLHWLSFREETVRDS